MLWFQAGVTGAAMSGVVAGEGAGGHKSHTGIPVLHAGSHFRHGLLQLMIHTIDPLHDGKRIYRLLLEGLLSCSSYKTQYGYLAHSLYLTRYIYQNQKVRGDV